MTYFGQFSTKSAIQHPIASFIHNVWENRWVSNRSVERQPKVVENC
ncbi:hypothetical protein SynMVIR181_01343 [Synechococcus sp. MVIR-18-1]|nr:hypothetical protein SynMVIR181_01343 [Synechococcus sp. MVIR-18-1]